eukprot:scaffold17227_cov157-Isochrysis_galbana.AAC.2
MRSPHTAAQLANPSIHHRLLEYTCEQAHSPPQSESPNAHCNLTSLEAHFNRHPTSTVIQPHFLTFSVCVCCIHSIFKRRQLRAYAGQPDVHQLPTHGTHDLRRQQELC